MPWTVTQKHMREFDKEKSAGIALWSGINGVKQSWHRRD